MRTVIILFIFSLALLKQPLPPPQNLPPLSDDDDYTDFLSIKNQDKTILPPLDIKSKQNSAAEDEEDEDQDTLPEQPKDMTDYLPQNEELEEEQLPEDEPIEEDNVEDIQYQEPFPTDNDWKQAGVEDTLQNPSFPKDWLEGLSNNEFKILSKQLKRGFKKLKMDMDKGKINMEDWLDEQIEACQKDVLGILERFVKWKAIKELWDGSYVGDLNNNQKWLFAIAEEEFGNIRAQFEDSYENFVYDILDGKISIKRWIVEELINVNQDITTDLEAYIKWKAMESLWEGTH